MRSAGSKASLSAAAPAVAITVAVLGLWTSDCAIASDRGTAVPGIGGGDLLAAAREAGKAMERLMIAYEGRAPVPRDRLAPFAVPAALPDPNAPSNPNASFNPYEGRASPPETALSRVRAGEECAEAIARSAAGLGIPTALAMALGEVESSNWPWAVNAALTGRRFKTRQEAVRYVAQERRQGVATIDVGCLQVSLYWHADAFQTLEEAFDPDVNVQAGLNRLGDLKRRTGSWTEAVALYHGGDAAERERYTCAVLVALRRLGGGREVAGGAGSAACRPDEVAAAASRGDDPDPYRGTTIASLGPDARTEAALKAVQRRLGALGYNAGPADAKIGPLTASALSAFQASRGLPRTGRVTPETVAELGLDLPFEIASDDLEDEPGNRGGHAARRGETRDASNGVTADRADGPAGGVPSAAAGQAEGRGK